MDALDSDLFPMTRDYGLQLARCSGLRDAGSICDYHETNGLRFVCEWARNARQWVIFDNDRSYMPGAD